MREVLNISLPEGMRERVDALVRTGGYANASEYVRELIREDAKRREQEAVNRKLLEALETIEGEGDVVEDLAGWIEARKRELRSRRDGGA
ncbi:MAG: ribbon-helix-helix protein, CopG family [Planctomycetota bacterium]|nr:ribbon-helix-helix protein, CopG family [Planctomycetota bacterium]